MSLDQQLDIQVDQIKGRRGTTSPQLEVELEVRTNGRTRIIVEDLHADTSFRFPAPVEKTVGGPSATVNPVQVEQFGQNGPNPVTAVVELSQEDLETIEEYRDGEEVEVHVDLWVSGHRHNQDDTERGRLEFSEAVIPARWSEILEELGYHENRSFSVSLDIENTEMRDSLENVSAYVRRAEKKHDEGDYDGSMVDCRKAIETLLDLEDDLDGVIDDQKREGLSVVMGNLKGKMLGGFAHPGETTNIDTPLRRDSDFALGVTKSSLRYVSTILEEELGEEDWPLED